MSFIKLLFTKLIKLTKNIDFCFIFFCYPSSCSEWAELKLKPHDDIKFKTTRQGVKSQGNLKLLSNKNSL